MTRSAQRRAIANYRSRLADRGLARFEVQAPEADRHLIRAVARKLTEQGPESASIRQTLQRAIAEQASNIGGILAALRRSPLVGAGLDLARRREKGRKVDL